MNGKTIDQIPVTEELLLENGFRKYVGEDVEVFYNKDLCTHSGNCVKGNKEVFEVGRRPWILPDNASAEEGTRVIDTCPSGALKYIVKGEK